MKTNELTGAALDWAVAKCMTGGEIFQSGRVAHAVVLHVVGGTTAPYFVKDSGVVRCAFEPSTDWNAQVTDAPSCACTKTGTPDVSARAGHHHSVTT